MGSRTGFVLLVILILPLLLFLSMRYVTEPTINETVIQQEISFPKGSALTQIADSLYKSGLIKQKNLFVFWAKTLGYEKKLKAGIFSIPEGLTYPQLVNYLVNSKPVDLRITLLEGWSRQQIIETLGKKLKLSYSKLDSLSLDVEFCGALGINTGDLTGYLLPDTYHIPFGTNEDQVLRFLAKNTLDIFKQDSVIQAMQQTGYSQHQILTLASIVEGEAILESERAVISSVYWNRLRKGIRLQADPTIQFLLEDQPRRLLYRDLKIDSPYNTYKHKGLPPGPINNPGRSSIMATLFPVDTDYYYFVARGDGSHVFSRTGSEHNRAKAKFNKVRREVAREKRNLKRN